MRGEWGIAKLEVQVGVGGELFFLDDVENCQRGRVELRW